MMWSKVTLQRKSIPKSIPKSIRKSISFRSKIDLSQKIDSKIDSKIDFHHKIDYKTDNKIDNSGGFGVPYSVGSWEKIRSSVLHAATEPGYEATPNFGLIMPALYMILKECYYAQNYAGMMSPCPVPAPGARARKRCTTTREPRMRHAPPAVPCAMRGYGSPSQAPPL